MSLRRNFIHNCIWHPIAGIVWTLGDLAGRFLGMERFMHRMRDLGDKIHDETAPE